MRSRAPTEADWPAIHALANQALPNAPDGNDAWVAARLAFRSDSKRGAHHLFEDDGAVLAFGAIEESGGQGRFRLFLVTRPDCLAVVGDEILRLLIAEGTRLRGSTVWMREHADDPLVQFAMERGFRELQRYVLGAEHGAYTGVEVVELERGLR